MYVNTTAEVKALTDYCCTSANAVDVVRHIYETHGPDTEILFGPDMWLGAYVEKELGRRMHVWDGECHVHAGIRPADIEATRAAHPGADFLIHPECGCSTSVMEYVAAGDVAAEGVHMLSTGGMLRYADGRAAATARGDASARRSSRPRRACSTRCRWPRPTSSSSPPTPRPAAVYMKMITLPKLRDALRDDAVTRCACPTEIAAARAACRSTGWSRSAETGRRLASALELVGAVRADAGDRELLADARARPRATSSKVTASSARDRGVGVDLLAVHDRLAGGVARDRVRCSRRRARSRPAA